MFFKAQVLFWLLAAIDGHAKNSSIFIEPDGRYRMTPLYDIMSAYPLLVSRQLEAKKNQTGDGTDWKESSLSLG